MLFFDHPPLQTQQIIAYTLFNKDGTCKAYDASDDSLTYDEIKNYV
jgi:hypothetical protein